MPVGQAVPPEQSRMQVPSSPGASETPPPRPTELKGLDPDVGGWRRDGKGLSFETDNGFEIHAWLRCQD